MKSHIWIWIVNGGVFYPLIVDKPRPCQKLLRKGRPSNKLVCKPNREIHEILFSIHEMAMDQYLYIPFLGGWTSIYSSPNESSHRPPKRLVVGRFLIDHKAMHAAGWWHVRHPSWVWRVHWTEMIYTHIYIYIYIYLYETNDLHIV